MYVDIAPTFLSIGPQFVLLLLGEERERRRRTEGKSNE
jgi:hypothetical protein